MSTGGDQKMAPQLAQGKWRNTLGITKNGPSAWMLLENRRAATAARKTNDDLGLLPSSENAETLQPGSTQETQKNPRSFME